MKRSNPTRYLTTFSTVGRVYNLCSPHLVQETVPATEKAQSGCKNDSVLKTQEKAWIIGKKQSYFSTSYHLLDHISAVKHPQHHAMALPLHTGACEQRGGHPALAQPPPRAAPQLHRLHHSSLSADCAGQGWWLIKVTDRVSIEREACFSAALSSSVNLWFYQLCATGSFRPDRWQSISSQPLVSDSPQVPKHARLDTSQMLLQTEINLQNCAAFFLSVF